MLYVAQLPLLLQRWFEFRSLLLYLRLSPLAFLQLLLPELLKTDLLLLSLLQLGFPFCFRLPSLLPTLQFLLLLLLLRLAILQLLLP